MKRLAEPSTCYTVPIHDTFVPSLAHTCAKLGTYIFAPSLAWRHALKKRLDPVREQKVKHNMCIDIETSAAPADVRSERRGATHATFILLGLVATGGYFVHVPYAGRQLICLEDI